MQFSLCLALGYSHPDVMLETLTARQYVEWLEYYKRDPWGEQRADLRAGIIACTMSNRWRGKNEEASEPADFMPYTRQEQTAEEIKFQIQSVIRQVEHNGSGRNNQH